MLYVGKTWLFLKPDAVFVHMYSAQGLGVGSFQDSGEGLIKRDGTQHAVTQLEEKRSANKPTCLAQGSPL